MSFSNELRARPIGADRGVEDLTPADEAARAEIIGKRPGVTCMMGEGLCIEVIEFDKSNNVIQRWIHTPSNRLQKMMDEGEKDTLMFRSKKGFLKAISDAFLPVGFPHSVSADYAAYQTYDSLQAFFSTITSLLANRALLQGLGVGDANSTATSAMLLTILKDAMSRVATIVFAQQFGLKIEPDAKRYRFLADVFNDSAFFLELYSPYFGPVGKVAALATGEALRALCGVAAGASKAALSVHFAKHDNLAELNAKEASQETAVGLVGLLIGTLVVKFTEDHSTVVALMVVLVLGHLALNYLGVCSVQMTTINRQRGTILFEEYLKNGTILSPAEVAQRENIIFWEPVARNQHGKPVASIEISESYWHAMGGHHDSIDVAMVDGPKHTQFIWSQSKPLIPIKLLYWTGADSEHIIRAWFMAMEIAWLMDEGRGFTARLDNIFSSRDFDGPKWSPDVVEEVSDEDSGYEKRFCNPALWEAMARKGWNLDTQALEVVAPVRVLARPRALSRKDQ